MYFCNVGLTHLLETVAFDAAPIDTLYIGVNVKHDRHAVAM